MTWTPPPPPSGSQPANNEAATGAPPPPPPPAELRSSTPPPKPISKVTWILLVLTAAAAFGGYWYYNNKIDVPKPADIQNLIEQRLAQPGLKVKNVATKLVERNGGNLSMEYTAVGELTESKYELVSTEKYLADHGADPAVAREIQLITSRRDIKEILVEAKLDNLPAGLQSKKLVRQTVATGKQIAYAGHLAATRGKDGWTLNLTDYPQAGESIPNGLLLAEIRGDVIDVDRPENNTALSQLVKCADPETLKRLNDAITRLHDKHVAGYLAQLQPGTLFKGTATKSSGDAYAIYLEISNVDTDRQTITAALRNDGGWDDFRRFQGTYVLDDTKGEFTLQLNTRAEQMVQNCGPVLDWQENFEIAFNFDGTGLTAVLRNWGNSYEFKLNRIADDQKAKVIANATDSQQKWLAATEVGKNYQVLATWTERAWTGNYYFTFTKQDCNGASASVAGVLRGPNGWHRQYSGMLVLNSYRAGGKPLRLGTDGSYEAEVFKQDPNSPLGPAACNMTMYPQLDVTKLACDAVWHWEFTPYAGDIPNEFINSDPQDSNTGTTPRLPPPAAVASFMTLTTPEGKELSLPKATVKHEANPLNLTIGTFYFNPTREAPKLSGNNLVFTHKGLADDLSDRFETSGFESRFLIFKLSNGKGILTDSRYEGVLNTEYKVDPDSKKIQMDSGHFLGLGKTTVTFSVQDIDSQTRQIKITSALSSGKYAIMMKTAVFIFEYVAPAKN